MIVDTLKNASDYAGLSSGFDQAFDFLRRDDLATLAAGQYELDGDRVFAMVQEYTSRPIEQGLWEAHRKYADVQFIVSGQERMGVALLDAMTESKAYNPEEDAAFYDGQGVMLPFKAGMFAVFLPQDVHMPGIADGQPQDIRKVIVKVQVGS